MSRYHFNFVDDEGHFCGSDIRAASREEAESILRATWSVKQIIEPFI